MARRKKHHKKTHHRRRVGALRMGGIKEAVIATAGVAGGIIAGRLINNMINSTTVNVTTGVATQTTNISPTILGAGEAVVGGMVAAKMKNSFVRHLAMGFGGNGLMYALSSKGLNVLPAAVGYGPDRIMRPPRPMLYGFRDVPKIGFPKPGNIGMPPPNRANMARRHAGVYGC